MVKIKICGMKRPEDIEAVNRYLPDYVGFVFADSRRKVTEEQAERLAAALERRIVPVGVFVNEEQEKIVRLCRKEIIRAVQLHGDETKAYIRELGEKLPGIPLIKAVRVRDGVQIQRAQELPCDYLLLDTFTEEGYGGSGKQFNIGLIPSMEKPYFLAGGLSAENIQEILESLESVPPCAVDVSSAVEVSGLKDEKKIKEFIERVRRYE